MSKDMVNQANTLLQAPSVLGFILFESLMDSLREEK